MRTQARAERESAREREVSLTIKRVKERESGREREREREREKRERREKREEKRKRVERERPCAHTCSANEG